MARALESVPPQSPLLVIDAQSRDGTAELARARGARTIVRPWAGFVATRRFALSMVTTPWTFMLDADEALDAAVRSALARALPSANVGGYTVARTTHFCGRAMRAGAWGREAPLRLFRTESASVAPHPAARSHADVHERWSVGGRVERLAGTLEHYSYPDLRAYAEKFERYTSLEARAAAPSRHGIAGAAALAFARFAWLLVGRAAWRDGWRGWYVAAASACYPVAVAWKAWRLRQRRRIP